QSMWGPNDAHTLRADYLSGEWGVNGSHNAYVEVCLDLGLVGLIGLVSIIGVGLWRGLRCCSGQAPHLGWFSFTFFVVSAASGLTDPTLALNQNIVWLVFILLVMSCGSGVYSREHSPPVKGSIYRKHEVKVRTRRTRVVHAPNR